MTDQPITERIIVPSELAAFHAENRGAAGRAWNAALPGLAAGYLDRWELRRDGPSMHGTVSLVLPVRRADGTPAILKLAPLDEETAGEGAGLRAWGGRGSVRLLAGDPGTGALLLERLDARRSLGTLPDPEEAVRLLAGLLARLTAHPAPPGLRTLGDVAGRMLDDVPYALGRLSRARDRRLVRTCADAVRELIGEPGDRLLHWDLHYENVLAGRREPWLAIDPKPLAGDPGFDLLPALVNRWDDVVATGDAARAVRRRFDLMTEALGLDRRRAAGWTLGRVLQNVLWDVEDGERRIGPEQATIARAVLRG